MYTTRWYGTGLAPSGALGTGTYLRSRTAVIGPYEFVAILPCTATSDSTKRDIATDAAVGDDCLHAAASPSPRPHRDG